jgi:hypothetical protein
MKYYCNILFKLDLTYFSYSDIHLYLDSQQKKNQNRSVKQNPAKQAVPQPQSDKEKGKGKETSDPGNPFHRGGRGSGRAPEPRSSQRSSQPQSTGGRGRGGRESHRGNSSRSGRYDVRPNESIQRPLLESFHVDIEEPVIQFWQNLIRYKKSERREMIPFKLHSKVDKELWFKCWHAASSGYHENIFVLVEVLLELPNVPDFIPPANIALNAMKMLMKRSTKSIELEVVVKAIRDRLHQNIAMISSPGSVVTYVDTLFESYKEALSNLDCEFQIKGRLYIYGAEFDKFMNSLKSREYRETEMQVVATSRTPVWLVWRDEPSVDWLLSGAWIDTPPLSRSYESAVAYAKNLLRVWTMLTFYWGAAALWPRCTVQNGDKVCSEPLLVPTNTGICSQRVTKEGAYCSEIAAWRCCRRNHHAICKKCLRRQQQRLCGCPGTHASTDVYDGVVNRETIRKDSSVYLVSGVTSRRPPNIAPNWRTSYRLKASGLVAVVRLMMSGDALLPDHVIQWAEIVPYRNGDSPDDDWQHRARGDMALRLIGRSDCPSFPSNADQPLQVHGNIAIIDLRVFVPEVVSVLSTFARDSFDQDLSIIPFVPALIGQDELRSPYEIYPGLSPENIIGLAIDNSDIEALQTLSMQEKAFIKKAICSLKQVKFLYGTQLEAFALGLSKAVHCTQGPPGTGKSFVGVALALAYVCIKNVLQKMGRALGPVLMLSYKNHALDEILVDILRHSNTPMMPGSLIRVGKPEKLDLEKYRERSSPSEKTAEKDLMERIDLARKVTNLVQSWKRLSDSFHMKSSMVISL